MRIWSILLILMFSCSCYIGLAQGKEDFNKSLFEIKQKCLQINRDHGYVIVTKEKSELPQDQVPANLIRITAYYKNDSLKKLVELTRTSNGVVANEYYVFDGQLVFVSCKEKRYVPNTGSDNAQYTLGATSRYYYENEKLIDTSFNGGVFDKSKDKDAAGFLATVRKYEVVLKGKK